MSQLQTPEANEIRDQRLGWLPERAIIGTATGSCGDTVTVGIEVTDGVVAAVGVRCRGSAAAATAAVRLAEMAEGRDFLGACSVGMHLLEPLGADQRSGARVAEDALHHALGNVALQHAAGEQIVAPASRAHARTLVAMSGGVDSAGALLAAVEDGDVVGATLRLWIDPKAPDPELACCAPSAVHRARDTCLARGVPHISLDLRRTFAQKVVAPAVGQWSQGETPNPCITCNGGFRLDALVRVADAVGCTTVATGHYARIGQPGGASIPMLRRAADERRDQSYMLARTPPEVLSRLRFPLGELSKDVVRERTRAAGMVQSSIGDSQELCFLGGGDHRDFLRRAGALGRSGTIIDDQGTALRSHDGVAAFTPGQRKGLGLGSATTTGALYVIDIDPSSGSVTVGDRRQTEHSQIPIRDLRACGDASLADLSERALHVRLRHHGGTHPGTLIVGGQAGDSILLDRPAHGVAPGQLACCYDDNGWIVASGIIRRSAPLP